MQNSMGFLVLGMHRSGTSALARMLNLGGADIGSRVLGASAGNEAGHWEDAFAVETHERLLAGLGSRWDEPFALPAGFGKTSDAGDATASIARYVADDRMRHRAWAVKDPRLCLFADLWTRAAHGAGAGLAAVVVLRHPSEVAASLAARDGIGPGQAMLLWLDYTLATMDAAHHLPHCVVEYGSLLDDWRAVATRIATLAPGVALDFDGPANEIEAFLDPGRRHHRHDDHALEPLVAEAWAHLRAAARDGVIAPDAVQWLASQLRPLRALLAPYARETRQLQRTLWERIGRAEGLLTAGSGLESLHADLAELRERSDRHRADLVQLLSDDTPRLGLAGQFNASLEAQAQKIIDVYSQDIRAMQQVHADAIERAAASEREATVAGIVLPEIRLVGETARFEAEALRAQLDATVGQVLVPEIRLGADATRAEATELRARLDATVANTVVPEIRLMGESARLEAEQLRAKIDATVGVVVPETRLVAESVRAEAKQLREQLDATVGNVVVPETRLVAESVRAEARQLQEQLDATVGNVVVPEIRLAAETTRQEAQELRARLEATVAESLLPAIVAAADVAKAESNELRARVEAHAHDVVDLYSREVRRMQDVSADALQRAAASEREATLVGQVLPRIHAAAETARLEADELRVRMDRQSADLMGVLTDDIRRMQEVTVAARMEAAVARQEGDIARLVAPTLQTILGESQGLSRTLELVRAALLDEVRSGVTSVAAQVVAEAAAQEMRFADLVERFDRTGQLQAERQALGAALESERTEIHRLQRELVQLRREVAESNERVAELDLIKRSSSWRVTRPLRVARRLLTGQWTPSDTNRLRRLLRMGVRNTPMLSPSVRERLVEATLPAPGADPSSLPGPDMSACIRLADALPGTSDVFVWAVIDWHFRTQRPQHLARALAEKGHRVFYISNNFVDSAEPGFGIDPLDRSGRLFQIHLHLEGAPAIYFDMPSESQVEKLRASLASLLGWTCTQSSLSLVQHPYWSPLIRAVPNARVVYDCMDHHAGFLENAPAVLHAEAALVRDSDLVVVTSDWLEHEIAPKARATSLIRNAGEYEFFHRRPERVFADESGRKVIGYYGAIADWFDVDLVRSVALACPEALVLLVGDDTARARERLEDVPNVRFTGEVPYAELPYWLYGFDLCLLPFRIIPLTLATNPVKVYEYLSAGKPVVSVDLPEMRQFGDLVRVAADSTAFIAEVRGLLESPSDVGHTRLRQAFAAEQTWAHRAVALDSAIATLEEPRVSVIVLTYNNLAYTEACLFSIEAYSDYRDLEVIVVDNASTDGTREWLEQWASTASVAGHARRVILNEENLGFSAGNNVGLRAAAGEILVILNNDTYVTPGWVRTLCNHLRCDPGLGLVGPVTNNIGNEARIDIAYPDMETMIALAARYTRANPGALYPMRTAAFFCVAMRRDTYERVGPMDEEFGVGFFEDDDYCRRIEQAGLRVACADDVFVHHHLSASFNALHVDRKQALFERNKVIYERKWGAWVPHVYRSEAEGTK